MSTWPWDQSIEQSPELLTPGWPSVESGSLREPTNPLTWSCTSWRPRLCSLKISLPHPTPTGTPSHQSNSNSWSPPRAHPSRHRNAQGHLGKWGGCVTALSSWSRDRDGTIMSELGKLRGRRLHLCGYKEAAIYAEQRTLNEAAMRGNVSRASLITCWLPGVACTLACPLVFRRR